MWTGDRPIYYSSLLYSTIIKVIRKPHQVSISLTYKDINGGLNFDIRLISVLHWLPSPHPSHVEIRFWPSWKIQRNVNDLRPFHLWKPVCPAVVGDEAMYVVNLFFNSVLNAICQLLHMPQAACSQFTIPLFAPNTDVINTISCKMALSMCRISLDLLSSWINNTTLSTAVLSFPIQQSPQRITHFTSVICSSCI